MAVKSNPIQIDPATQPARPRAGLDFYEVEGILLVRLMSRCNERCPFCMVADEIATSDDVAFAAAVARIESQPRSTQIEFFGGEPTIYPRFLDLLRVARSHEHVCSIASNVRIFNSEKFTQRVAELGASKIYIRTSLYGDTEILHDRYTAVRGSHRQTLRGIQRIVEAGFPCQVNIVILRENFKSLEAMTRQVYAWGVPRIKFGMLTGVQYCAEHAPSLTEVGPHLRAAIGLAESLGLKVTVEKTPACAVSGRLDLLSTEREIYSGIRQYNDAGACGQCLLRRWCDGLDPGYAARYGIAELTPMFTVPRSAINRAIEDTSPIPLLETQCVEIPDTNLTTDKLEAIAGLIGRVQARHGRIAIFPSRCIRDQDTVLASEVMQQ